MGSKRLYSFGCGACGQLGSGNTGSKNSPSPIQAPFLMGGNTRNSQAMDHSGQQYCVKRIYAGGDHCFIQTEDAAVSSICALGGRVLGGGSGGNSQAMDHSGQHYGVKRIYAGGDHCFIQTEDAAVSSICVLGGGGGVSGVCVRVSWGGGNYAGGDHCFIQTEDAAVIDFV